MSVFKIKFDNRQLSMLINSVTNNQIHPDGQVIAEAAQKTWPLVCTKGFHAVITFVLFQ